MLINFAYNPNLIGKPPEKLPYVAMINNWRHINGGFVNKRGRPETLAKLIQKGHPYTATHRHYRHQRNFIKGQVLSLDFDTDDERSSFNHLLADEFISQYAYFLYSTPSSTPSTPRSRAVFILPQAVDRASLFAAMQRSLVIRYQKEDADPSCKDPCRIFFGSADCKLQFINNILPLDVITEMAKDLLAKENSRPVSTISANLSNETVKEAVNKQLNKILSASNGSKHAIRLRVGTTIGGYVAAGYIDYNQASNYLIQAAMSNTSAPGLAEKDVLDGLNYGLNKPLEIIPRNFTDLGIDI